MNRPDDPFLHPAAPALPPADPTRSPVRAGLAFAALAAAVGEVPWFCGGAWRPLFAWAGADEWPTGGADFVRGRAVMVAPALVATALAVAAVLGRPAPRVRWMAVAALVLSLACLLLVSVGVHWHAGD